MDFERVIDTEGVLLARGGDGALRARCAVCRTQLAVVSASGGCPAHPLASADIAVVLGGHLTETERAAEEARLLATIWASPVEPQGTIPDQPERGPYVDSPGGCGTHRGNGAGQPMS